MPALPSIDSLAPKYDLGLCKCWIAMLPRHGGIVCVGDAAHACQIALRASVPRRGLYRDSSSNPFGMLSTIFNMSLLRTQPNRGLGLAPPSAEVD